MGVENLLSFTAAKAAKNAKVRDIKGVPVLYELMQVTDELKEMINSRGLPLPKDQG